ncbi:hypothetical protein C2845_PM07G37790 [Panicum miliaceum]|uniref:DUF1677 family protein n=1 Tax=Panicum miliaceum TaxID=4540 RepID=A0A3L6SGF6_PANMI|nr:hypothetical protein C2845_PM07G37790 [Panicum miliaceum]
MNNKRKFRSRPSVIVGAAEDDISVVVGVGDEDETFLYDRQIERRSGKTSSRPKRASSSLRQSWMSDCRINVLAVMESQDLRRACSEIANKLEKLVTAGAPTSNPRPDVAATAPAGKASAAGSDQQGAVETVRCACCGGCEDCTASYIRGVRASFCGAWLCGLCAEAVKERARRDPAGGVAAALGAHEAECRDFNATTRLNPTLSLAGSMRRIARRSLDRRTASCKERGSGSAPASRAAALARSASCDPWFLADVTGEASGDRRR